MEDSVMAAKKFVYFGLKKSRKETELSAEIW
jgi:hypothetical protein